MHGEGTLELKGRTLTGTWDQGCVEGVFQRDTKQHWPSFHKIWSAAHIPRTDMFYVLEVEHADKATIYPPFFPWTFLPSSVTAIHTHAHNNPIILFHPTLKILRVPDFNPPANGYKRFVFPDGKGVYDGHWRGYKRHGHGSFSFANGDTYDGEPGILSGNGVSRCFWIGFL